jgi:hypothetical protein
MMKGDLVTVLGGAPVYTLPVGIEDQLGAIRHYAGMTMKGQPAVILSDPDDWKAALERVSSADWTQILLGGQVVWLQSHFISDPAS